MSNHELIPDPGRLISSLRDMGYDFSQAVADLVDNSIEAQASRVDITFRFHGDDTWVRIADNGVGMAPAELREAMRYGSARDYSDDDLGKFGLGLKTASMSQCTVLTVASRRSPQRRDIAVYSWDLEHIKRSKRWEILEIEQDDPLYDALREPLEEHTGTVVLWQKLDRILGYSHPYGESARKRTITMAEELMAHLGMVFHRFLAGEIRGKRIAISVNGHQVPPWDPFCRSGESTFEGDPYTIAIVDDGMKGSITLQSFILPHKDEFTSPRAFDVAAGPAGWNQQQGFYIYRAGRMIQSGGWSHLRKADEHTKLARVSLSFKPELDELFKINVAKMRVQVPASAREEIKEYAAAVSTKADARYRRRYRAQNAVPSPAPPGTSRPLVPDGTAKVAEVPAGPESHGTDGQVARGSAAMLALSADELVKKVIAEATPLERPHVLAVLRRLGLRE